jgi:aminopeptidase-like protein
MLSTVEIVGSVFYAKHRGLFSALSGVDAPLKYAKTAKERAQIDRVMAHVLGHIPELTETVGFRQAIGNDETAFDVHGINVPCGSLMRWPYEHYHTHFDSSDKIDEKKMEAFIGVLLDAIEIFEKNSTLTGNFDGLPQLGHPDVDLYLSPGAISGIPEHQTDVVNRLVKRLPNQRSRDAAACASNNLNMMMTLIPPLADGRHTTLDVAERSGVPFALVDAYTDMWKEKALLSKEWVNPFSLSEG